MEAAGGFVHIEVRDNGTGIPPALLPCVFDFYRQGESSSSGAFAGLGIGLALVKSLVELHGGSAHAHSDGVGTGSAFVVRLPATGGSVHRVSNHLPSASGCSPMNRHPAIEAMVDA